jgi:PhnB protein
MPALTAEPEAKSGATPPQSAQGVVPHLTCPDAPRAIGFYIEAFGARELSRHLDADGKRIMHAHLRLNQGDIFLHDDFPEYRGGAPAPVPAGICLHLHVTDARMLWDRAVKAGAAILMPLDRQAWGDIYGQLKDPWGYVWSIGETPHPA